MNSILFQQLDKLLNCVHIKNQKRLFDEFLLDVKIEFKKEEKKYSENNHPDLETHIVLHTEFIRTLESFNHFYFILETNQTDQFLITMEYAKDWLEYHFETDDFDMMPVLRIQEFINDNN